MRKIGVALSDRAHSVLVQAQEALKLPNRDTAMTEILEHIGKNGMLKSIIEDIKKQKE